ncbi:MAG: anthranilate phosphoribosyltransferase [Pyrinomonadaceae bacterium]|nr:anthranilate phosphoribosyltransferase [Pyrinomonadaceae bacterium]
MKSELEDFLKIVSSGKDLSESEAAEFFTALQSETENESLIAAVLLALEAKGATADELYVMAKLMRSRAVKVNSKHETFVDIVGTGGSSAKIFNVSTAAAFVIAGANLPVAKHGNRAATSNCGSADVLSELGVNPAVDAAKAEKCLNEIGICFMFAPNFHALSPVLGKVRRELGRPTIFNNLGPLCNPANAPHQIIGVWRKDLVEKTAQVLAKLGTKKSWIVHGADGLDEITLNGATFVAEISGEKVKTFEISPADFGLSNHNFSFSKCSPTESAKIISDVLHGKSTDENARNIVLINAAAAVYIAGRTANLSDALAITKESLGSGKALEKLESLKSKTKEHYPQMNADKHR